MKGSIWKFVWSVILPMLLVICAAGTNLPAARADEKAEAIGHNNDGVKLLNNNDYKGALEEFTKAVDVKPDYGLGYTNRIITNDKLGNCQSVVADYEELIRRDLDDLHLVHKPTISSCYAKLGLAKQKRDEKTAALECFNKAIELNPSAEYYRFRAVLKQEAGDGDGAKNDFEQEKQILETSRPKSEVDTHQNRTLLRHSHSTTLYDAVPY